MKLKRILLSLVVVMLIIMFAIAIIPTNVLAATATTPLYLGITELRTNNTPNLGYAIGNPNDNGVTGTAAKIWNIVRYSDSTSSTFTETDIYCVKAGVGFSDTNTRETYNTYYNMKTKEGVAEILAQENTVLPSIVNGDIQLEDGTTISKYHALLALSDMLYLANDSSTTQEEKAEQKTALLEAAGIYEENWDSILTDDEVEAIQQAAIWYFTNYGEEDGKYDKTDDTGWLNYTEDGEEYNSLSSYNPSGAEINNSYGVQRQQQAETLYKYLINTAKENAGRYDYLDSEEGTDANSEAPAKVITKSLNYEESGDNYIIGPINIAETEGNSIPYTIDFTVTNGGEETTNYTLLNSDKTEVEEGTTVKDLVGQDFYISLPKDTITTVGVNIKINYSTTTLNLWTSSNNNQAQPVMIPDKKQVEDEADLVITPGETTFDLALRKYITKVGETTLEGTSSRVPNIDTASLETGTTATYKHKKDPVIVETGDTVTYNLTIYNEGEKAGRATKIVDQLPTGLRFNNVVSGNFELSEYNEETNTVTLERIDGNTENLEAYTEGNLDSETIEIECTVEATASASTTTVLTNVAWIAEEYNSEDNIRITNQDGADRDSEPATIPEVNKDNMANYTGNENKSDLTDSEYFYKGQQDDDDFEKLILMPESFDLKLIKRIVAVNDQNVPERIESIDVSDLNTLDENGNLITTAEYNLNKEPVSVKKGDIVTYTFRIYNEGTIDGYAQEITEDIPEGLEFIWSEKEGEELAADETLTDEEKAAVEFNQSYLWGNFVYDEGGEKIIQISTDYLSKENETTDSNLIEAFGDNDGTKTEADLHYKEVSVKLKVVAEDATGSVIRNEACISEDADSEGNPVDDRDSDTEDWVKYEDDEDYDNIILQIFDLSLRKFIIAVSDDTEIGNDEYLKNDDGSYSRAPVVDTSLLNTTDESGNMITTATYNHTKEPVIVRPNDYVIYMLRVYNEGDMDGYAAEIKDHLPPYLEYVDSEFNTQYGWEVSEDGRTVTTRYLENSIVNKAEQDENGNYVLSYVEVPIMCKVSENATTSENITNIADITEYQDENKNSVNDRDSVEDNVNLPSDEELPGYKDDETGEYVPGQEDDDDFEKVIVKIFDLSLRKWVTQAIVIDNTTGETTITDTGHGPYDDPEDIVKVELYRKNINNVTVKFRYSIRVTNEGEIAGYAKEVTDYVPEGLRFLAEDNPGWTDEGNNVISTRLLENTLLQPGEYAEVEVVLTWINSEDNMGVMNNIAEISEDYNDYDVPDIDSTPDNQVDGEDDIDDAPVMLSISTGRAQLYLGLGFIILITIAGGVVLIKRFVL